MKRTVFWFCILISGLLGLATALPSCRKAGQIIQLPEDTGYASRIAFLLLYNPAEFQGYYANLVQLGLQDTLAGDGPFTVFAYNSQAYADTSYASHSIIRGRYPLNAIPPGQTEVIDGPNGFKWIITANVGGGQVQYTVNGAPVLLTDQPASNGLIEVLTGVFPSVYYPSCLTAILSNENYIDFAYALHRTHLDSLLADTSQAYTVFAPTTMGGLAAVRDANLDSLTNIVKYLIVPGRIYNSVLEWQYSLTGGMVNDTLSLQALNSEYLNIVLTPPPNSYGNIGIMGLNDQSMQTINNNPDIIAGLGVIKTISNPLTP